MDKKSNEKTWKRGQPLLTTPVHRGPKIKFSQKKIVLLQKEILDDWLRDLEPARTTGKRKKENEEKKKEKKRKTKSKKNGKLKKRKNWINEKKEKQTKIPWTTPSFEGPLHCSGGCLNFRIPNPLRGFCPPPRFCPSVRFSEFRIRWRLYWKRCHEFPSEATLASHQLSLQSPLIVPRKADLCHTHQLTAPPLWLVNDGRQHHFFAMLLVGTTVSDMRSSE